MQHKQQNPLQETIKLWTLNCRLLITILPKVDVLIRKIQIIGLKVTLPKQHSKTPTFTVGV